MNVKGEEEQERDSEPKVWQPGTEAASAVSNPTLVLVLGIPSAMVSFSGRGLSSSARRVARLRCWSVVARNFLGGSANWHNPSYVKYL